jgi:hypothetical protein
MSELTLMQIEAAINYWRAQSPSAGEELRLCPQASALAQPYAMMIIARRASIAFAELGDNANDAWQRYCLTLT